MKHRVWILFISTSLLAATVGAADVPEPEGPPKQPLASAQQPSGTDWDPNLAYKKNRLMQVMGYAMLAASAVITITGAGLVEGSPWGPVSKAGIICIGVGLGHFITAAFLLGFSKAVIRQELPPVRPLKVIKKGAQLARAPNGDIYFQ